MRFCFFFIIITFCWSRVTDGQSFDQAKRVLKKAVECHGIAGLAVAVVRDNQTLLSEVFGYSDIEQSIAMTKNETMLMVASLSKAMSSTVLSLRTLERRYNYTINQPILKFIPSLQLMDAQRTQYTTINDLLAHRVGIPRYDMLWLTYRKNNSLKWAKYLDSSSQFRSSFRYSNIMYKLAGDVLAHLSGQSWSQLVHTNLFRPLGMTNARLMGDKNVDRSKFVRGFFNLSGRIVPVSLETQLSAAYIEPAAGVILTLNDIILWMTTLTSTGYRIDKRRNKKLDPIRAALLETTRASNAYSSKLNKLNRKSSVFNMEAIDSTHFAPQYITSYGRGWVRSYYRERLALVHKGSMFGVDSYLSWFPRENISVFVTGNFIISRQNPRFAIVPKWLSFYLADLALNATPWINEDNVCEFLKSRKMSKVNATTNKTSSSRSAKYVITLRTLTPEEKRILPGVYSNPVFGRVNLRMNTTSGRLEMYFGELGRLQLIPVVVGHRNKDSKKPIAMLTRVVGPLWFYTSYLRRMNLDEVSTAEKSGRKLPRIAYKMRASFHRCPKRRGTIKWVVLNIMEPSLKPHFTRVGAITEGDEYSCDGCLLQIRNELIVLLFLVLMWRRHEC